MLALKYLSEMHFFMDTLNLNMKYRSTRAVSDGDVKEFVEVILWASSLIMPGCQ